MTLNTSGVTGRLARKLSQWCAETADTLRTLADSSDLTVGEWWAQQKVSKRIVSVPEPGEEASGLADRLRTESDAWAALASEREPYADTPVRVERFTPAEEMDGPFNLERLYAIPAVALRFEYNEAIIKILKSSPAPTRARGWSKPSWCWWVVGTSWPEVRWALLDKGVRLTGSRAHPKKPDPNIFPTIQDWDPKKCVWFDTGCFAIWSKPRWWPGVD
jgi:hypothetical protein